MIFVNVNLLGGRRPFRSMRRGAGPALVREMMAAIALGQQKVGCASGPNATGATRSVAGTHVARQSHGWEPGWLAKEPARTRWPAARGSVPPHTRD